MKNRIMRKIAAAGMAVFLVGMSAGSGYIWKDVSVYAAEAGQRKEACIDAGDSMKQSAGTEKPAVREDKETVSEVATVIRCFCLEHQRSDVWKQVLLLFLQKHLHRNKY